MTAHASAASGTGDLARLLSTEGRLEESLRQAREAAAGLVAAARDAAQAREAALEADLDTLGRKLEATITGERQRLEQELAESAQHAAQRFDDVDPKEIEALARYVVARVIGGAE